MSRRVRRTADTIAAPNAEAPTAVPATCPTVDPTTGEPLRNPVIEFASAEESLIGGTTPLGHVVKGFGSTERVKSTRINGVRVV